MNVTCPACQTRYLVDDSELRGEAGRRVRCASCGNLWFYSLDAAAIQTAVAEATAEVEAASQAARPAPASAYAPGAAGAAPVQRLQAEPGTVQARLGQTLPRPAAATELPPSTGPSVVRLGMAALMLVAACLVLFVIFGRYTIIAVLPSAAPIYATLRLTEPPAAGLDITAELTRTSDSVIVAGDIVNRSPAPRPLGRLQVTLLDGAKTTLETRLVAPPVSALLAGATARYETIFEHPSITAVAAAVAFAAE